MAILSLYGLLICLAGLVMTPFGSAHIETLSIRIDDRVAFHIESFGFSGNPPGHFQLNVSNLSLFVPASEASHPQEHYNLAFLLQATDSDTPILPDAMAAGCLHENRRFDDDIVFDIGYRTDWKFKEFTAQINEPGDYHLYFSNCVPNSRVSFDMQLVEYNVVDGYPMYLSTGETSMPAWYFILSLMFGTLMAVWALLLIKNRSEVKSIHLLMLATVSVKFLSLVVQSFKYHSVKWNGVHDAWFTVYYFFAFLKGVLLFCVIVLLGAGWSYLKPFLTDRDKFILLAVVVTQSIVNIALIIVSEEQQGEQGWQSWKMLFYFMDVCCCLFVLIPIISSIEHFRQSSASSNGDPTPGRSLERLKRFRSFYATSIVFIYFTRIVVFLLESVLSYKQIWFASVVSELSSFIYYFITGRLFRPAQKNPYLSLKYDSDDGEPDDEEEVNDPALHDVELEQL